MGAILGILPMLQTALGIIGTFRGSAQLAKATGYVQDAVGVVNVLTPLVTAFGGGQEVTEADVRKALAGMHGALADFDAEIAKKGG